MRATYLLLTFMMGLAGCDQQGEGAVIPADPVPAQATRVERIETNPASELSISDAQPFTLVMLGDSLTAGFGLATDEALPEQVAMLLEKKGQKVKVVNAGVSGDTTAGGLARYDWSVASARPDLLVVALGANDFLGGIPAATARANLAAILKRAQADGVKVLLAGVSAEQILENDARIRAYAVIYEDLAVEYDVPLYADMLGGVRGKPTLLQLDGLHPTREGVKVMAARMTDFIEDHLPEETP